MVTDVERKIATVYATIDIEDERLRQDERWGPMPRDLTPEEWLAILVEEVGEVAKAIVDGASWAEYRRELIQVAAVAAAAAEDGDFAYGRPGPEERAGSSSANSGN